MTRNSPSQEDYTPMTTPTTSPMTTEPSIPPITTPPCWHPLAEEFKRINKLALTLEVERDDLQDELDEVTAERDELLKARLALTQTILKLRGVPEKTCVLCEVTYLGFGNNAQPLADGLCCDECNFKVLMGRLGLVAPKVIKLDDGSWKLDEEEED